jgi:ribosomal protein L37AE/L43A
MMKNPLFEKSKEHQCWNCLCLKRCGRMTMNIKEFGSWKCSKCGEVKK